MTMSLYALTHIAALVQSRPDVWSIEIVCLWAGGGGNSGNGMRAGRSIQTSGYSRNPFPP